MIKNILLSIFILLSAQFSFAQNHTDTLFVTGKVKNEKAIPLSNFTKYKSVELGDINTSCSPKQKEEAKQVKAVLVKDLLDSVEFAYESRKEAADGYTIVYSFNEIYNTETGNHLYVVTEMNGKPISELENRILLLTTSDIKSGSRNIKWLKRIVVCRAE